MDGKPHILVVDDEIHSAENEKFILEKNGFHVSTANSAEVAFRFLLTTIPDLILLDVVLPDIPGTEFCKAIKQDNRYSAIPVVLISGSRISSDESQLGISYGAASYITRPFKNDLLIAGIRNALSQTREHEDKTASDREMQTFKNLSQRDSRETSVLFNAVPLKMQYPESYRNILNEYDKILSDAIEERCFKVEQHLHEKLNHLSDNLGF